MKRRPASTRSSQRIPAAQLPLVWFALFRRTWEQDAPPRDDGANFSVGPWSASVSPAHYAEAIRCVKDYIARGHTYQVNYSFRLRASFRGEPWSLFQRLCEAQRTSSAPISIWAIS